MRVLRSQEGFAAVSADPRGEPSQTPIYEGGEPHCTVIDESIHAYVVYHDAVLVADDRDRRRNENRAKVTTDSTVHRRRAGAESESLDRFRRLWTDLDALRSEPASGCGDYRRQP